MLGRSDIKTLKVGFGKIGEDGIECYHIGPVQGKLDFEYSAGKTSDNFSLVQMMTFGRLGFTILSLKTGDRYAIHQNTESLPQNISYQQVPTLDYMTRRYELTQGK